MLAQPSMSTINGFAGLQPRGGARSAVHFRRQGQASHTVGDSLTVAGQGLMQPAGFIDMAASQFAVTRIPVSLLTNRISPGSSARHSSGHRARRSAAEGLQASADWSAIASGNQPAGKHRRARCRAVCGPTQWVLRRAQCPGLRSRYWRTRSIISAVQRAAGNDKVINSQTRPQAFQPDGSCPNGRHPKSVAACPVPLEMRQSPLRQGLLAKWHCSR